MKPRARWRTCTNDRCTPSTKTIQTATSESESVARAARLRVRRRRRSHERTNAHTNARAHESNERVRTPSRPHHTVVIDDASIDPVSARASAPSPVATPRAHPPSRRSPGVDTSDDSTPLASASRRERRRRRAAPRARTTLVDSSREGEANRARATREGRRRPSARPRRRGLHWRDEDSRERRAWRRRREA